MKEERKQIKLEEMKKENVFQVPEGYFEALPTRIRSAIANEKQKPVKFIALSSRVAYYAAACLVVLLVVLFSLNSPEKEKTPEALLSGVSTNEMIDYLETSDLAALEVVLTEEDQKEILEEQLDNFDMQENYDLDLLYLEEYL